MRQKHHHAPHPGQHAVGQQVAQIALGHPGFHPVSGPAEAGVDPVHRDRCHAEDRGEQRRHQPPEDQPAEDRMQQHTVEFVRRGRVAAPGLLDRVTGQLADSFVLARDKVLLPARALALHEFPGSLDAGHGSGVPLPAANQADRPGESVAIGICLPGVEQLVRLGQGLPQRLRILTRLGQGQLRLAHRHPQALHPLARVGLHRDHRHTQLLLQSRRRDFHPARPGDVHHVQHHDGRDAQVEHLHREVKIALEVAGIDHADDAIRLGRVGAPPQQHIPRDGLVRRASAQAVRAGKVEDSQQLAVLVVAGALLFLDRHPGVVGHLLGEAGQGVEQRRLAGVRVPHKGDDRRRNGGGLGVRHRV